MGLAGLAVALTAVGKATIKAAVDAESAVMGLRCVTTDPVLITEALEWARQQYATSPRVETTYASCIRYAAQEISEHGRLLTERERYEAVMRRQFPSAFTDKIRVLSPRLPLHTRAGLTVQGRVDVIGCWLVEHGHTGAAERLWRLCRMWR